MCCHHTAAAAGVAAREGFRQALEDEMRRVAAKDATTMGTDALLLDAEYAMRLGKAHDVLDVAWR